MVGATISLQKPNHNNLTVYTVFMTICDTIVTIMVKITVIKQRRWAHDCVYLTVVYEWVNISCSLIKNSKQKDHHFNRMHSIPFTQQLLFVLLWNLLLGSVQLQHSND